MKDKTNIKRKLLTDRSFPETAKINQRRDFKSIKEGHNGVIKNALLKKMLVWGGSIVGTAVIAIAVYLNNVQAPASQTKANKMEVVAASGEAYIQQPLPGKEIPFSTYRVSAKNGGIIHHENGSTITVPANAFAGTGANGLSDSIDIKYREFHNPYEIFVSGIPMKYDSAGTEYTFESAGMIEIFAFQRGEKVELNEGKEIKIAMISANDEANFNLYELDTSKRNWKNIGKDNITEPAKNYKQPHKDKEIIAQKSTAKQGENDYVKPQLADSRKFCFNIGYDKNDFPELEAYDNVLFEVTDNSFKPSFYKINWDKISLHSGNSKGLFVVKLTKADTTIAVNAKPVFDKENYDRAMSEFEAKQTKAQEKELLRTSEKASKLKEVNDDLSSYNRKDLIRAANFRVQRTFSIQAFGIYNCDRPILAPVMEVQQIVNVVKEQEPKNNVLKEVQYSTIYVVEKGKNAVFSFSKNEAVAFNPALQNLIWTVTDKKEIAFFKPNDFTGRQRNLRPVVAKNQELALAEIRKFSE